MNFFLDILVLFFRGCLDVTCRGHTHYDGTVVFVTTMLEQSLILISLKYQVILQCLLVSNLALLAINNHFQNGFAKCENLGF